MSARVCYGRTSVAADRAIEAIEPGTAGRLVKYESTTQKGLWFWAEYIPPVRGEGPACYMVVSQADGFEGGEAFDDWFGRFEDADRVAGMLARGEDVA